MDYGSKFSGYTIHHKTYQIYGLGVICQRQFMNKVSGSRLSKLNRQKQDRLKNDHDLALSTPLQSWLLLRAKTRPESGQKRSAVSSKIDSRQNNIYGGDFEAYAFNQ